MDFVTSLLVLISAMILLCATIGFLAAEDKSAVDGWFIFGLFLAFTIFVVPWAIWTHYDQVGWDQWKIDTAETISNWVWAGLILGPIAFVIAVIIVHVKYNDPRG